MSDDIGLEMVSFALASTKIIHGHVVNVLACCYGGAETPNRA